MVRRKTLIDLSSRRNNLLAGVDFKIANGQLNYLNDQFSNNGYPITVDREQIKILLEGIDFRIRKCQMIEFEFFDSLNHDFICGDITLPNFNSKVEFNIIGTVIYREFGATDHSGYAEIVNSAFQDFILTLSSLLENLVRLKEILIRKVILNTINDRQTSGNLTMHLFKDFYQTLVKLEYRIQDNLYNCLSPHFPFFDSYLRLLYRLRGSMIHAYTSNLELVSGDGCYVRNVDNSFQPRSLLYANLFVKSVYSNVEKFTTDLLDHLIQEISIPTAKIPL